MKRIITSMIILLAAYWNTQGQSMVTNGCESSPCNAISICGIGPKSQINSFTSTGNPQGTCGANFFTNNWVYYRLTCYASGNLLFTITPNDPLSDLNWALWNITTNGCGNLSNTSDCNAAVSAGAVVSPAIALTVGNTYILGVQRASGGTATFGFNITFTGTTASLTDAAAPSLVSLLPYDTCSPVTQLKIKVSESIRCSQLDPNDFTVSGSPTYTVAGSSCPGCVNGTTPIVNFSNYEDTLVFTFPVALSPGNYTIAFNPASPNLPRDFCNNLPNTVPNITFNIPLPLTLVKTTGFNCTAQTYIDTLQGTNGQAPYQYKVKGGSQTNTYGTSTNSFNVFTGLQGGVTYTLYVKAANGCVDSIVTTHPALIPLQSPNLSSSASPPCFNQFALDSIATGPISSGQGPYKFSIAYSPSTVVIGTSDTINGKWKNISFSAGASFTVTVKDAWGCTKTAVKNLINPTQLVLPTLSSTSPLCFGDSSGTCSGTATGGTGPWNYTIGPLYQPPMTSSNSSPSHINNQWAGLPPVCFTMTVTDANGCTATNTKCLTSNLQIVVKNTNTPNPVVFWNPTCINPCGGKIKPYATGGVGTKKNFYLYTSWPSAPVDSVKYIGVTTVTDSFFDATILQPTGLCAGTYTVMAVDQAGCTATNTITLALPAYPDLVLDSTINVSCFGGCSGKIYTTTSVAAPPFTYTITPNVSGSCTAASIGVNTGDYQNLGANTYMIIVTKTYGADQCKDTINNIIITEPTQLVMNAPTNTNILCNGDNTGEINMTATGGTGTITYTINPLGPQSNTTGQFTGLTAQCYTITGTDANGCSITSSVCLTQPTALTLSISNISNVSCFGDCDGEAEANAGGGAGGYIYYVTGPGTIDSLNGEIEDLCLGTYTVTVKDANNCTKTTTFSITQPTQLNVVTNVTQNALCFLDCNGTATITPSGATPTYNYTISGPGTPSINASGATGSASGLCAGTYTVTVTDDNGCAQTATILISQPALLTAVAALTNNPTCANACNGVATVTPAGGTSTYSYVVAGPGTPSSPVPGASATITNMCNGVYTITVTDAHSCTTTVTITITDSPAVVSGVPVITNALCFNSCDGTTTMSASGGIGGFTYSINPTTNGTCTVIQVGNVFSGLWAGSYTVTVQDANACTSTTSITITQPALLVIDTVSVSHVSCNSLCDGQIVMSHTGGTGAVTYSILPNAPCLPTQVISGTFGNLGANLYTIQGTDANGCTATRVVNVGQPSQLTLSITAGIIPTCNPGCDGTAQATAANGTPGYSYTIAPSGTINAGTGAMSNLCAGTNYTVTATDGNGCSTTAGITMITPNGPIVSITGFTLPTCNPGCDGIMNVSVSGGVSPYTYSINGGATVNPTGPTATTTATGSNLCANTNYTLTVTDANSCVGIADTLLTTPPPPTVNLVNTTNITCNGLCNGVAVVSSTGGTGAVTFGNLVWQNAMSCTPSQTVSGTFTGLGANTYTVTGTDASGCTGTISFTITQPTPVAVSVASSTNPLCNGLCTGSITVNSSGGTPGINYSISPLNNGGPCVATLAGNVFSGLWAATFTITATDANGCSVTTSQTITQPAQLVLDTVSTSDVSCNSGCDGTISMTYSGGTGAVTYGINPGVPCLPTQNTIGNFGNLGANLYTVQGADANGCTATYNVLITQPSVLTLAITAGTNPTCTPGCNGTAQANPSGGTPGYSYGISGGASISSAGAITNICAGVAYTVTLTDAEGCTKTASITMITPNGPVVSITAVTGTTCNPGCDGTFTVSVSGGTSPYSYAIDNGGTVNPVGPTAATTCVGSNICSGPNYILTVTDANQCVGIADTSIDEPVPPVLDTLSTTSILCSNDCNGSIQVFAIGGANPITYTISLGLPSTCPAPGQAVSGTFTGLGANVYTIEGTDNLGCIGAVMVTLVDPPGILLDTVSTTNVTCFGACTGQIVMSVSGGVGALNLSISPLNANGCNAVQVGNTFSNLAAGVTYTITATDANACTSTKTVTLTQPPLFTINTLTTTNISCFGACDGKANMTYSGGAGSVTYSILPNAPCPPAQLTTGNFTLLGATTYTVTGTDANGCTATKTFTLTQPAALSVTIAPTQNPTCNPGCDGKAQTNPIVGGTPGYTYSIAPGGSINNSGNATLLCANVTYTITVTDANLCTATTTIILTTPGAPTASVTSTVPPTCAGNGCNGTANITGVGNTATYTYTISSGGTITPAGPTASLTPVASNLCPNITYTVTITDANLCTGTTTILMAPPTAPVIDSISTTPVSCVPGCNGTITMSPAGLTYTVSGFGSPTVAGNVISGLCSNQTYTIIGTNAAFCKDTFTFIPPPPVGVACSVVSSTPPSCNPGCDGTATMGPIGLSYAVNPAATVAGNLISGLCNGTTYTITSTDANNCTNSSTVQLFQPSAPTVIANGTPATQFGVSNGSVIVSNPIAGATYSINPSPSTNGTGIFLGLAGDDTCLVYTVTITDQAGCTNSDTACVDEPPVSGCSQTHTNVSCFGGNDGTYHVDTSGGAGGWTFTSNPIGVNPITGTATGLIAGSYTVTATDLNLVTCTQIIVITQPAVLGFSAPTVVPTACTTACSGSIIISATGGTTAYSYAIAAPANGCTPVQGTPGNFTNISTGTYTITVTDANLCTASTTVVVAPPAPPVINSILPTNVLCNGGANGQIIVNATGATQYSSNNGNFYQPSNTFNGLTAGTYTVVAMGSNGCTASSVVVITQPSVLVIDSTVAVGTLCANSNNGTITVYASGGAGGYQYSLDCINYQGSNVFSGLVPANYTVCVLDANGCTKSAFALITSPTAITWTFALGADLGCFGDSSGSIAVLASGGSGTLQYALNPGVPTFGTATSFNTLSAGTYTVSVKDANNCLNTTVIVISEPPALVFNAPVVTNNLCYGTSAGTISIGASGGLPFSNGYIFSINPNIGLQPATGSFTQLPAGTYAITVLDSSGCSKVLVPSVAITQPPQIVISIQSQVNIECNGAATGIIDINATGGTGVIGYVLTPGNILSANGNYTNLTAGTYTLFAADQNQCSASIVVTLTEPPAIQLGLVVPTEPICHGDANGALNITAQGGQPPYQYGIDGGPLQPSGIFTGLVAKTYVITVMDSKGCIHVENYILTEPDAVGAILNIRDAKCVNSKDGRIVVTATGGRGGYKFYIMPGLLFNKSGLFTDLAPGVYNLRVLDTANCEYNVDFTINPPAVPLGVTITKQDLGCTGKGYEGQATANVFGGEQPYTYLWFTNPVQTDAIADSLYYGWYKLQVLDANGCLVKDSVYIEEGPCCDVSFIPNAFSPNGDGNNDVFRILTTAGVELQQLEVYDRWGKRVWGTNNYRFGWDGTIDGKPADIGSYYFIFKYICTRDQKTYTKKGDVILIR